MVQAGAFPVAAKDDVEEALVDLVGENALSELRKRADDWIILIKQSIPVLFGKICIFKSVFVWKIFTFPIFNDPSNL